MKYLNIAVYHFFDVKGDLEWARSELKTECSKLDLMGTILLSREGINCMLVGASENIQKIKDYLIKFTGEPNLRFKDSWSDEVPFDRMKVKVKSQVIPMDNELVDPSKSSAPRISPEELKKWLDEKKDFLLLDTRNEFEIRVGTFETAKTLKLRHFRYYEEHLKNISESDKEKPIVTFCTGGIRCEKAAPLMINRGFKEVYQLDGGILNYFEKVGGDHFKGDCFVFDKRVALDENLNEADVLECPVCRDPITREEQKLESFKLGVSCPHCIDK